MNPVWKLNFFLFNIEGYGEFFSGITPEAENQNTDNGKKKMLICQILLSMLCRKHLAEHNKLKKILKKMKLKE
jgi:hypothetical protein